MQAIRTFSYPGTALRFGRRDHGQPAESDHEPATVPQASSPPPSPPPYPPHEALETGRNVPLNFIYQNPRTGQRHHSAGLVTLLDLVMAGERSLAVDSSSTESSDYEEGELPNVQRIRSTLPRVESTSTMPFVFIPPGISPADPPSERPSEEILRLAADAEARRGRLRQRSYQERELSNSERVTQRRGVLSESSPSPRRSEAASDSPRSRSGHQSAFYELT